MTPDHMIDAYAEAVRDLATCDGVPAHVLATKRDAVRRARALLEAALRTGCDGGGTAMNRCYDHSFALIVRPDGRRGLWLRAEPAAAPVSLELIAGREGDDERVAFNVGEPVTPEHMDALQKVLAVVAYSAEIQADGTERVLRMLEGAGLDARLLVYARAVLVDGCSQAGPPP